ncbi:MAG: hypothetical protein ABEI07_01795 [Candidatus Nanohaloarchaea archaeon]
MEPDRLFAFGHAFIVSLGLLLAAALMIAGIMDTSDEGLLSNAGKVDEPKSDDRTRKFQSLESAEPSPPRYPGPLNVNEERSDSF